jgi:hypothetical protein
MPEAVADPKVGEVFEVGGVRFKALRKKAGCKGCAGDEDEELCNSLPHCSAIFRHGKQVMGRADGLEVVYSRVQG